jgi:hypothetical protein
MPDLSLKPRKLLVEITITENNNNNEIPTYEEEADNIKGLLLDACGYPDNVELDVKVLNIEYFEKRKEE